MIKLVLLDVDGTLTDTGRLISVRAVEAIRKAQKEGIIISLASGNVVPVMYGLKTFVGIRAPVFAENGGVMFQNDEIFPFFSMDKPKELFDRMESEGMLKGILSNRWRLTSMAYVPTGAAPEQIAAEAEKKDLVTVDSGYSWHLLNKGQDKGFALEKLKESYSLDYDEILVMGDAYNDAPMFKKDVVKVVPSNAEESLKAIADHVAKESNGDGVAEVLQNLQSF